MERPLTVLLTITMETHAKKQELGCWGWGGGASSSFALILEENQVCESNDVFGWRRQIRLIRTGGAPRTPLDSSRLGRPP